MATSSVNVVNTLGAGSGIDTKALAQSLVEAERAPRKERIDDKIKKEEARITGHGVLKSVLMQFKEALARVNDANEFTSITPNNSQPMAFGVTAGARAVAGTYSVEITAIAKATRLATQTFASSTQALNGGTAFSIEVEKPNNKVTETHAVTFSALTAGQSVTVAGLTLTATGDLSAEEVASAFSTPGSPSGTGYALTGSLTDWTAGSADSADVVFTSTTANRDVTDLVLATAGDASASVSAPGKPKVAAVQGSGFHTINVTAATPAGLIKAFSDNFKATGINAQLINTGNGYAITFGGQTGALHAFTLSGLPSPLSMRSDALQDAQDATLEVNGLAITSASNKVVDAIPGITLDLYAETSSGAARLDLNRQTAGIKESLRAVVDAYNLLEDSLKLLGDSKSEVEEFGGTLAGDSILATVRTQVRALFVSSNPDQGKIYPNGDEDQPPLNPDVYAARHVGLSFDRTGQMTLDSDKLDQALAESFEQVVTLFTANKNGQSVYGPADGSLAGDAVKNIDKMLRSTGFIEKQTQSATVKIEKYRKDLTQLEERMSALLERYAQQFSVMDSIVGQSNSTRTGLTNSFKGLMAMYTNN
jgi:flagellar hook-associated protein 2